MGDHLKKCAWKMIDSDKFVLGVSADRCGAAASVRVIRPTRKTDLYLCEHHTNEFIKIWGLHNQIEILCSPEDFSNWVGGPWR